MSQTDRPAPKRGNLRIYLGAAPGVGKTFAMLNEGRRRSERGTDVVVAIVETHGRTATADQLVDLEVVPRRRIEYRDTVLEELDVDAVIARAPEVALVDELAHTNAPGSRNEKRWQDIDEMLVAGIDVISTVNVQHLESLNDVVERITRVRQRETVPDAWVRLAEQIELVDMTPEAIRRRMAHGNIYPAERIDAALGNYFRPGNLGALRELALLWLADRVEDQVQDYLEDHHIADAWETRERVIVALTGAPGSEAVIRRAGRLARRLRGELIGVHVARSDGLAEARGPELGPHRRILEELGGTYREVVGDDVAETLVAVARTERATQVVIGASRRSRRQELTGGSVVNQVLRLARDLDVHVISAGGSVPGLRSRDGSGPLIDVLPRTPLSRRRRRWAWGLLVVGLPVLVAVTLPFRNDVGFTTVLLLILSLVVAIGTVGGLLPGIVAAVAGAFAANYFFVAPYRTLTVSDAEDAFALVVFVAVGSTVSTLVDRVARRSADAVQARADADALARGATALATDPEPVPAIVSEVRGALGMTAASVLERGDTGGWTLVAASGDDPPLTPGDGSRKALTEDGRTVLVLRGHALNAHDGDLLDALAGQLTAAVESAALQREAAAAEVMAQADALRNGILQAVSHDLRTPLAGIKASVTSLLAPDVDFGPDDTSTFLATIDTEVDRLDRVVGNLLDMSRLQTGGLRVLNRPTALEEVVAAAVSDVDAAPSDRVELRVPETLPLVAVDGPLLERALVNVLANALAVQPEGVQVVVEAAAIGDQVHLRVVDRGPGIAPAHRATVFEPFQRLGDRSTQAGVGLGLAIAQGLTRAVDGDLELDDTPGGGLTVVFRLPVSTGSDSEGSPP